MLSVVADSKGTVVHHEIKNQSGVLNAEGKHFTTWDDLINWGKKGVFIFSVCLSVFFFFRHHLTFADWKFSMNAICPGSKYETFLLAAAAQGGPTRTTSSKTITK